MNSHIVCSLIVLQHIFVSLCSGCVLIGDFVTLQAGLESTDTPQCIKLSSDIYINEVINVNSNKTLIGNGYSLFGETNIANDNRLFKLSSSGHLSLRQVSISSAPNGVFILKSGGSFTATNCTFKDNYASEGGSVLLIEGGSELSTGVAVVSGTIFENNNAGNGLGSVIRFTSSTASSYISSENIYYNNFPFNSPVVYLSPSRHGLDRLYIEEKDKYNSCEDGFIRLTRTTACTKCPIYSDCPRLQSQTSMVEGYRVLPLNEKACSPPHAKGELCELCEDGYYKANAACVRCGAGSYFLRVLCFIMIALVVRFISHISLNISNTATRSSEFQTCEVMRDILYEKFVHAKKEVIFQKLRHSHRSMLGLLYGYYDLKGRVRKWVQIVVYSTTGAVCTTMLIGISHVQVSCLMMLPLLRCSLRTDHHVNGDDDLVFNGGAEDEYSPSDNGLGKLLLSFAYGMDRIFNFGWVSVIFSPDCSSADPSRTSTSRYLLSLAPLLLICLYYGSKIRALEKSDKYSTFYTLVVSEYALNISIAVVVLLLF